MRPFDSFQGHPHEWTVSSVILNVQLNLVDLSQVMPWDYLVLHPNASKLQKQCRDETHGSRLETSAPEKKNPAFCVAL